MGGAVLVGTAVVVVGAWVVAGTIVVVGAAVVVVSVLPLHAEATSSAATTTAYFFTIPVCHPSPEGKVGGEVRTSDTRSRYAAVDVSLRTALFGVGLEKFPSDAIPWAVLATAPFASGVSKI